VAGYDHKAGRRRGSAFEKSAAGYFSGRVAGMFHGEIKLVLVMTLYLGRIGQNAKNNNARRYRARAKGM
jgi:hypothetical protein